MTIISRLIGLGAALWLGAGVYANSDVLTAKHWLNWERAADARIAPDGDTILYTRSRVDAMKDRWAREIWAMDLDGGRHRFVTNGSGVQWSPSGDRIAYIAADSDGKPQIFVRYMDAEGSVSQITHSQVPPSILRWAPDGQSIAFRARVPADPIWDYGGEKLPKGADERGGATIVDDLHFRQDRVGLLKGYDHLFVVPADGGTAKQLTSGRWHTSARFSGIVTNSPFDWTPDSTHIVFDGNGPEGDVNEAELTSAIHKIHVETAEITTLTAQTGNWGGPVVSPDGKTVAYGGQLVTVNTYNQDEVRAVGIDGSNERVITDALPNGAGPMRFAANGRSLIFSLAAEGDINVMQLTLNGRLSAVTKGDHQFALTDMSDEGLMVGRLSTPGHDWDLAVAERDGDIRRLTNLNGDILDGVTLGSVEEIWYDSSENTRVQGWIITPPDFDESKTYPLAFFIHGGPHAMYGVNFRYVMQVFAAKGYVALYTNPRGSTGYGRDFANAIDNAYPGQRDFDDLMAGVDVVVNRGYIDTERMYVSGCSGGGVLTSWVVGNTDRFAAAASRCPVINWISFAGQADIAAWSFKRFHKPWWEDTETWLKHSPLMRAPHTVTPTLFITGDKDLRTPIAQAEEMFAALKMVGTPTRLVAMHGEYHGTSSIPSNMLRTIAMMDSWFRSYPATDSQDD